MIKSARPLPTTTAPDYEQINLHFLVAMFAAKRGMDEAAYDLLLKSATLKGELLTISFSVPKNNLTLARYELLARGVGPEWFVVDNQGAQRLDTTRPGEADQPEQSGPPPAPH